MHVDDIFFFYYFRTKYILRQHSPYIGTFCIPWLMEDKGIKEKELSHENT